MTPPGATAKTSLLSRLLGPGKTPLRLLAVPRDHVLGDRRRGEAILTGRFPFGADEIDLRGLDRIIEIDERSMTVTAQAGVNGNVLEAALNERGLMLPHYPASSEWATVGGYIAARGSGVLSTRYGKIEDLLLSLRVALASGELIETVGALLSTLIATVAEVRVFPAVSVATAVSVWLPSASQLVSPVRV